MFSYIQECKENSQGTEEQSNDETVTVGKSEIEESLRVLQDSSASSINEKNSSGPFERRITKPLPELPLEVHVRARKTEPSPESGKILDGDNNKHSLMEESTKFSVRNDSKKICSPRSAERMTDEYGYAASSAPRKQLSKVSSSSKTEGGSRKIQALTKGPLSGECKEQDLSSHVDNIQASSRDVATLYRSNQTDLSSRQTEYTYIDGSDAILHTYSEFPGRMMEKLGSSDFGLQNATSIEQNKSTQVIHDQSSETFRRRSAERGTMKQEQVIDECGYLVPGVSNPGKLSISTGPENLGIHSDCNERQSADVFGYLIQLVDGTIGDSSPVSPTTHRVQTGGVSSVQLEHTYFDREDALSQLHSSKKEIDALDAQPVSETTDEAGYLIPHEEMIQNSSQPMSARNASRNGFTSERSHHTYCDSIIDALPVSTTDSSIEQDLGKINILDVSTDGEVLGKYEGDNTQTTSDNATTADSECLHHTYFAATDRTGLQSTNIHHTAIESAREEIQDNPLQCAGAAATFKSRYPK